MYPEYWSEFRSFFGRIQDAIICFWDLLTFREYILTNVRSSNYLQGDHVRHIGKLWPVEESERIYIWASFFTIFVLGGVLFSIQKGTTRHLLLQYINLKKVSSVSHFDHFSFSYSLFLRITFAKLSILLKLESEKSHCTF